MPTNENKSNNDNTMKFVPLPNLGLLSGIKLSPKKVKQNASLLQVGGDFTGVVTGTTVVKPNKQGDVK